MVLELFVLLSGPLLVGAVVGAWVMTGRLFLGRLSGPAGKSRWPLWIPSTIGGLVALIGLVILAGQIITLSGGSDLGSTPTPFAEQTAAVIVTMFLSPVWVGAVIMAGLGMVLHYTVDRLLKPLNPIIQEGLALGLRAAWALLGLLTLLFGLQLTYNGIVDVYRATLYGVLLQLNLSGVLRTNVFAILVGLMTIYIAVRLETQHKAQASPEEKASTEESPLA